MTGGGSSTNAFSSRPQQKELIQSRWRRYTITNAISWSFPKHVWMLEQTRNFLYIKRKVIYFLFFFKKKYSKISHHQYENWTGLLQWKKWWISDRTHRKDVDYEYTAELSTQSHYANGMELTHSNWSHFAFIFCHLSLILCIWFIFAEFFCRGNVKLFE